jgi:IS5 family transposase
VLQSGFMEATDSTSRLVRTTIAPEEMADLLNLLADLAEGRTFRADRRQRAIEVRESIIAGTPEAMRVGL